MRIKEIELDNFKSFGKSTLVPLLDGFTTISGPNGSGKSNIIDSLLFALGLSSTRSMRAERLPDLLNNLSGKKEAKVRVKFVSPDNVEIEVTRRIKVKEDNSYTSTYLLNGKVSTLTEIHDRLMRYNVSPTGFNVIMQGDVTGIVTMSATERRRIIDELAGVAQFDRHIDQAQGELTAVAEKIEHQRIVLTEIIARLEVLRSDRDQALKYLDLKTKKETIERDLIFVRAQELEEKAKQELAEIARLEGKESEIADKLHETEINLLALRAEMGRIDEEIKNKGGNEQLLLRQELENKRGELTREENKLSNLQGVIGEKEKRLKNIQDQVKAIEKHLSKLGKQKKQHIEDMKAVELVLMERQGAYSAVMAEIEVHRQEKDKSSEKVSGLHTDLQSLRDEKHTLSLKKTELETRRKGVEKELEGLRSSATEKISKSASLKTQLGFFEKKFVDQDALVLGIDRSIEQFEAELDSTQEEIESKQQALQSVNRRIIELETAKEVSGESGYGRSVEAILKSGIRGVHGTLGQLGSVDEDYQVALETCIGARMTHIVVDDDHVAQECINYLKDNNAGRATFVPLNKIVAQPPGLLPTRPGVIDFAYNLVDFDNRFTKAFQYACGQTIVVDDIHNARKMINQARMVTTEGELFEKSGSITGGKDNKSRYHFSSKGETDLGVLKQTAKNVADQIRWLKDSVKELTQNLAEERKKQGEAKAELAKRKAEIENHRKNATDLDDSIESIKPQLRSKGDEIDVIDQESAAIDDALKDMEGRIAVLEQSLEGIRDKGKQSQLEKLITESEEIRSDFQAVENECKEIQRLIDRLDTEENVENNNRDGLMKELETVQQEITDIGIQKPVFEENIAALNSNIAAMEKKVSQISDELEHLRAQKDKIHDDVTAQEIAKTKLDQEVIRVIEQRKQRQMSHFDVNRELQNVKQEIAQILDTNPNYEPPNSKTVEELKKEVERLERRMRQLEPVNMKALEDYNTTEQRQIELDENLATLESEKDEILQRIDGYGELKKKTFMEAFEAVNQNFQEIFSELSHGHGRLELEHPDKPFEGGLIIRAQPRDKKMQRIEALSGGEKSLTALSFVFAFQRFAPAPFYAFDEVDMMLDGANAERLARMVKRQSGTAQFVVVSLRRPMIENSDHAIGVSLRADGYSRVVGIHEIKIPEPHGIQSIDKSDPPAPHAMGA
ncbi:MAG: chromosome segregation protein SMC [Candidatus Obscuribacterales bacterium]|nr:chromosome segregation protein SMC [Candidatus Obscuribacterales bacterium]